MRAMEQENMFFHYTVLSGTVAFGGLHESADDAESAKEELVQKAKDSAWVPSAKDKEFGSTGFSQVQADEEAKRWQNTPIVYLEEGQLYTPFGRGRVFKHGVDDGTHGSTLKPW